MPSREEERRRLIDQITAWNADRLDLFELSIPNETLEFYGVMRFFFLDEDKKYQTKCLRVSSDATTFDLLPILIEKFHPDLKMLGLDNYGVFETHSNGEERRLRDEERPLFVQLNWSRDDRDGKFILKNEAQIRAHELSNNSAFTRDKKRLSKKEKKQKELIEQEQKQAAQVPESSFTRTMSNPDMVRARRNKQRQEQRLESDTRDGLDPNSGCTLKIFADSLQASEPFKNLVLTLRDNAAFVVRETLHKYGMFERNVNDYCLVKCWVPPREDRSKYRADELFDEIMDDEECPVSVLAHRPERGGTYTFHLRVRPNPVVVPGSRIQDQRQSTSQDNHRSSQMLPLPYIVELLSDGSEKKHGLRLPLVLVQQGASKELKLGSAPPRTNASGILQLALPEVRPYHCIIIEQINKNYAQLFIQPAPLPPGVSLEQAPMVFVNKQKALPGQPVLLHSGVLLRLGPNTLFRFIDPQYEQRYMEASNMSDNAIQRQTNTSAPLAQRQYNSSAPQPVPTSALPTQKQYNSGPQQPTQNSASGSQKQVNSGQQLPVSHMQFNSGPPRPLQTSAPISQRQYNSGPPQPIQTSAPISQRQYNSGPSQPIQTAPVSQRQYNSGPPQPIQTALVSQRQYNSGPPQPVQTSAPVSQRQYNSGPPQPIITFASNTHRHNSSGPSQSVTISSPVSQKPYSNGPPQSVQTSSSGSQKQNNSSQGQLLTSSQQHTINPELLPVYLEYHVSDESDMLEVLVTHVNPETCKFKLAPAYSLYLMLRACLRDIQRPVVSTAEREHRLQALVNKTADCVYSVVQNNTNNLLALSFWMANASELLHFMKHDCDASNRTISAQEVLAHTVQQAFNFLLAGFQDDLGLAMPAFLDRNDQDALESRVLDDHALMERPVDKRYVMLHVLQTLSLAMTLLRRCRVNAALTIQLFSQLFHFVNMWLFNRLVDQRNSFFLTQAWGVRLGRRLKRVKDWAERQGLELAADCHLQRILQACAVLEAPKNQVEVLANVATECMRLNSLQLRVLLTGYRGVSSEEPLEIHPSWVQLICCGAAETADRLLAEEGRPVQLEEEQDLNLPLLLPDDGYSCDIPVEGLPSGLSEFLEPALQRCHLAASLRANTAPHSGLWTPYLTNTYENTPTASASPPPSHINGGALSPRNGNNIVNMFVNKINGSMGLSIVAAKPEFHDTLGIYVKSVVPGGAADCHGGLETGDQLLEVAGFSLLNVSQEQAARILADAGAVVSMKVAKGSAERQGLMTLLRRPSPVVQRRAPPQPQNNYQQQHRGRGGANSNAASYSLTRPSNNQHHLSGGGGGDHVQKKQAQQQQPQHLSKSMSELHMTQQRQQQHPKLNHQQTRSKSTLELTQTDHRHNSTQQQLPSMNAQSQPDLRQKPQHRKDAQAAHRVSTNSDTLDHPYRRPQQQQQQQRQQHEFLWTETDLDSSFSRHYTDDSLSQMTPRSPPPPPPPPPPLGSLLDEQKMQANIELQRKLLQQGANGGSSSMSSAFAPAATRSQLVEVFRQASPSNNLGVATSKSSAVGANGVFFAKPRSLSPQPSAVPAHSRFSQPMSTSSSTSVTSTSNPWEREQRETLRRELELRNRLSTEEQLRDLEERSARQSLSSDDMERLARLRIEVQFRSRLVEEERRRGGGDGVSATTADDSNSKGLDEDVESMRNRAVVRAGLIKMMREDLEQKQQQRLQREAEERALQEQQHREALEQQNRVLQKFERDREEERRFAQERQAQREQEQRDRLLSQQEQRDQQRALEEEQRAYAQREDERLRQKRLEEVLRKKRQERELQVELETQSAPQPQKSFGGNYGRPRFETSNDDNHVFQNHSALGLPCSTSDYGIASQNQFSGNKKSVSFHSNLNNETPNGFSHDQKKSTDETIAPLSPPPIKPKPKLQITATEEDESTSVAVIGAQEFYRDLHGQRVKQQQASRNRPANAGEQLSFADKMKLFRQEAGENVDEVPKQRIKFSSAQRALEQI